MASKHSRVGIQYPSALGSVTDWFRYQMLSVPLDLRKTSAYRVTPMTIPTEPIGSIPRPLELIEAVAATDGADPALDPLYDEAIRDTIARFEATGSPVDHRRRAAEVPQLLDLLRPRAAEHRPGRLQDPVRGRPRPPDAAADRRPVPLPAARRQLPRRGPAVRPRAGQAGGHLALGPVASCTRPTRSPATPASSSSTTCCASTRPRSAACLRKGAHKVQIDFTEGRLAVKIDPSGDLLHSFIDLNNLALARFSAEDRERIGVHTCPGGDRDSTHSARRRLRRAAAQPVRAEGRATSTSPWPASRTASAS